jgi:TorA maturation chaperone TorD
MHVLSSTCTRQVVDLSLLFSKTMRGQTEVSSACRALRLSGLLLLFAYGGLTNASARQGTPQSRPAQTDAPAHAAQRKHPPRPAELQALVVDARALPPEFAADVLLRLVEANKITERAWQRELLLEAFRTADGAQQPIKRRITPGLNYAYTREDYEARAFGLNLDTLSLRLRAVNAMLKVDKRKAREMFTELPRKLPLAPLTCDDALVYDVSDFYATLARIAQDTFSAKEKARDEDLLFVMPYVDEMSAPAQVAPIIELIKEVSATPERCASLFHAYTLALSKIEANDHRSFMASTYNAFPTLLTISEQYGIAQSEIREAFGAYFANYKSASQCTESVNMPRTSAAAYVSSDNHDEQQHDAEMIKQLFEPTHSEDAPPAKLEGAAKLTLFFTTPTAHGLFLTAQALRFGMEDEPQTEEERNEPKRVEQLTDWLNAMADWRGDGEASESDYFNQKCVLYQFLLEVWPTQGPAADTLLRQYIAFLREPARREENRAEWLLHVKRLLDSPRYQSGSERTQMLAELMNSGEPVLRVYAALQAAPPQPKAL